MNDMKDMALDKESYKEFKMVAALLKLDIDTFAKAFPHNEPLQLLKKNSDRVLLEKDFRENRYTACWQIFNIGK